MAVFTRKIRFLLPRKNTVKMSISSVLEPSYILHPGTKTSYPETQLLALTKSQILPAEQLPKKFVEYSQRLDTSLWNETIEKAIVYAHDFDNQFDGVSKLFPFNLLQNIIKILLSQSKHYPQLKDLFFAGDCDVNSTWKVLEQLMSVRGHITGTIVKSKNKSKVFFDEYLVKESESYTFPSSEINDVFARLNTWNIYRYDPLTPSSIVLKYPNTHSVILIDNENQLEARLLQRCVLNIHGLIMNEATKKYGTVGLGLLPEPECAQGVVTDGKKFIFLWYQLNTADCNDLNDGIKNLVTIYKPGQLYSGVEKTRGGQTHKTRRILDFDENILRTLLSMFLWQH